MHRIMWFSFRVLLLYSSAYITWIEVYVHSSKIYSLTMPMLVLNDLMLLVHTFLKSASATLLKFRQNIMLTPF